MTGSSTSNGAASAQVRQYLAAVDAACADLAPGDRARLVDGLAEHLAELSAEGVDLDDELGHPVAYANELRASAGLPPAAVQAAVPAGSVSGHGPAAPGSSAGSSWAPAGPPPLPGPARQSWSTGAKVAVGLAVLGALLLGGVLLFGVLGVVLFAGSGSVTSTSVATASAAATITVPDVVGMTVDQARATLAAAGLTSSDTVTTTTPPPSGQGPDVVLEQTPDAGTDVAAGSGVTLTVTGG